MYRNQLHGSLEIKDILESLKQEIWWLEVRTTYFNIFHSLSSLNKQDN